MANDATDFAPETPELDLGNLTDAEFAREFGVPVPEADAAEEVQVEQDQEGNDEPVAEGAVGDGDGSEPDGGDGATGEDAGDAGEDADKPEAPAKPLADFRLFDDDGDFDSNSLSKVKVEYKANGKSFADPFDKVVRLAQMGRLNEAKLQKVEEFEAAAKKASDDLTWYQEQAQRQVDFSRRLLEDEDAYMQEREKYLEEQTPEKRLQRTEESLRKTREEYEAKEAKQAVQEFMERDFAPNFTKILTEFPEVEEDEVFGAFTTATTHLVGPSGQIPRAKWPEARRILVEDVRARMQERHEKRVGKAKSAAAPLERQAAKAKVEATKAKRTLTRALQAPGGGPPKASAPKGSGNFTADQAADSVIDDLLATRGSW